MVEILMSQMTPRHKGAVYLIDGTKYLHWKNLEYSLWDFQYYAPLVPQIHFISIDLMLIYSYMELFESSVNSAWSTLIDGTNKGKIRKVQNFWMIQEIFYQDYFSLTLTGTACKIV